ncbi:MAG: MOSC N-terminal beta barrel domain-containing protein [Vicinamibacterales bacterium]
MWVSELWRYPVKSMAGELLQAAELTSNGIVGDRVVHVRDNAGRPATARTYPGLLQFHATLDQAGQVLVDGLSWKDAQVLRAVRSVVGQSARLVHDESLERFDILPLLVATDGAIEAFGRDRRRLRPNVVIGGVDGLAERKWEGGRLEVGEVEISIDDLRGRCVMTTFDPDTLAQDQGVLRDIVKRFGGKIALNCSVTRGGQIQVRENVEFCPRIPPFAEVREGPSR